MAGGAVMAALLYFLPFGKWDAISLRVRIVLAALRFLAVSLLLFLVLEPVLMRKVHEAEKPIVVIAHDNSRSVRLAPDSVFYANDYQTSIRRIAKRISEKYEVVQYAFGGKCSAIEENVSLSFDETSTDIASVFATVGETYDGCNVGAVILSTDGIYNKGANPASWSRRVGVPVYPVALGDTTVLCDAKISHVRHNTEASMGRKFPVEVTIVANRLKGKRQTLTVSHEGHVLYTTQIDYSSARYSTTESFMLTADKPGLQTYRVAIGVSDGEYTGANNSRDIHVRVLDRRQRVAIVAAAPHPDVAAIRRALELNEGFEVDVYSAEEYMKHSAQTRSGKPDMVVTHGLPCKGCPDVCGSLKKLEVPVLYILGTNTDINAFNALQTGVAIRTNLQSTTEATAVPNSSFGSFSLEGSVYDALTRQAPLQVPFGNYEVSPSVQTLLYSRVGSVTTESPLIAVGGINTRCAWIFGEGLWRWRLSDLADNGTSFFFDPLVSQMALYVSTSAERSRLKVAVPDVVRSNERLVLNATLFDDNNLPTNVPDVKLTLTGYSVRQDHADVPVTDGSMSRQSVHSEQVEYLFNRYLSGYRLDLGFLDEGRYVYRANATLAGRNYVAEGVFVVSGSDVEGSNLTADHTLLQTMARQSGGRVASPHELDSLADWLLASDDIKTVIHSHTVNHSMFNLWWIVLLLMVLFGTEWAVRKYNGGI